jgi:hypothetical protein
MIASRIQESRQNKVRPSAHRTKDALVKKDIGAALHRSTAYEVATEAVEKTEKQTSEIEPKIFKTVAAGFLFADRARRQAAGGATHLPSP